MNPGNRLLEYLDLRLNATGDRDKALAAARTIAQYLKTNYGATVYGIGSLFDRERRFSESSDIDLVVRGLPAERYFSILAKACSLTEYEVDLIPWEDALASIKDLVAERGVEL